MISTQHTIWCDFCSEWDQVTGSARDVLATVKRSGWRRVRRDGRTLDVCLKCAILGKYDKHVNVESES